MRGKINDDGSVSVLLGDPDLDAGEFEVDHMPQGLGPHIRDPQNPRGLIARSKPDPTYAELRAKEYPSTDALVVALWEEIVEGRTDATDALQVQRAAVKKKYPKPGA